VQTEPVQAEEPSVEGISPPPQQLPPGGWGAPGMTAPPSPAQHGLGAAAAGEAPRAGFGQAPGLASPGLGSSPAGLANSGLASGLLGAFRSAKDALASAIADEEPPAGQHGYPPQAGFGQGLAYPPQQAHPYPPQQGAEQGYPQPQPQQQQQQQQHGGGFGQQQPIYPPQQGVHQWSGHPQQGMQPGHPGGVHPPAGQGWGEAAPQQLREQSSFPPHYQTPQQQTPPQQPPPQQQQHQPQQQQQQWPPPAEASFGGQGFGGDGAAEQRHDAALAAHAPPPDLDGRWALDVASGVGMPSGAEPSHAESHAAPRAPLPAAGASEPEPQAAPEEAHAAAEGPDRAGELGGEPAVTQEDVGAEAAADGAWPEAQAPGEGAAAGGGAVGEQGAGGEDEAAAWAAADAAVSESRES